MNLEFDSFFPFFTETNFFFQVSWVHLSHSDKSSSPTSGHTHRSSASSASDGTNLDLLTIGNSTYTLDHRIKARLDHKNLGVHLKSCLSDFFDQPYRVCHNERQCSTVPPFTYLSLSLGERLSTVTHCVPLCIRLKT